MGEEAEAGDVDAELGRGSLLGGHVVKGVTVEADNAGSAFDRGDLKDADLGSEWAGACLKLGLAAKDGGGGGVPDQAGGQVEVDFVGVAGVGEQVFGVFGGKAEGDRLLVWVGSGEEGSASVFFCHWGDQARSEEAKGQRGGLEGRFGARALVLDAAT